MSLRHCGRYCSSLPFLLISLLGCSGQTSDIGGAPEGGAGTRGAVGASELSCGVSAPRSDYDSGFDVCDGSDRRVHRTHIASCQSQLPRSNLTPVSTSDRCTADDECVEHPNGFCDPGSSTGSGAPARSCQYGCLVDDDCATGSICLCGTYIGYCTPAECATDDDCAPGLLCAAYWKLCHTQTGFACQNPADTCLDDQSCGNGRCERDTDGIRRCTETQCLGL